MQSLSVHQALQPSIDYTCPEGASFPSSPTIRHGLQRALNAAGKKKERNKTEDKGQPGPQDEKAAQGRYVFKSLPKRVMQEKEEPRVTPKTLPCAKAKSKTKGVMLWEKISRIFKNTHHTALHSGCHWPHSCHGVAGESNPVTQILMDVKAAPPPPPTRKSYHHVLTRIYLHRQTLVPGHWPHPAADLPAELRIMVLFCLLPFAQSCF